MGIMCREIEVDNMPKVLYVNLMKKFISQKKFPLVMFIALFA